MSELNLKCPADFRGGIQDDWDNDYASMWAQVQSLSHNKIQYRKAWVTAKDEITRLQSEVERLRGRVAELEKCVDDGSDAWLLRKQAEAVEPAIRTALRNLGNADLREEDIDQFAYDYAQRLRQQAAEIEGGGQ